MTSTAENATTPRDLRGRLLKFIGLLGVIGGAIMIVAGVGVWAAVSGQLAAERIVVAEDAAFLAGMPVADPFTAYAEADIIAQHSLEVSGGSTYAELDRDDPVRVTMMNASFLRASLFTSIVSFGVAALAIGVGLLFAIFGWAVIALTRRTVERA